MYICLYFSYFLKNKFDVYMYICTMYICSIWDNLLSGTGGGVKPPYASGRDWGRIEKELAKEAEEKAEGEAALNEMFQKIYGDANDDVRARL